MTRRNWTHEDIKAAADGNFEQLARLDRRGFMKGSLRRRRGGRVCDAHVPARRQGRGRRRYHHADLGGLRQIEPTKDWAAKNDVKIANSSMATQDDVQSKLVGGSPVRLDVTSYNQAYNKFYADELKILNKLDMSKIPNYNQADIFDAFYQKERWYWDGNQWAIPFCWGLVA